MRRNHHSKSTITTVVNKQETSGSMLPSMKGFTYFLSKTIWVYEEVLFLNSMQYICVKYGEHFIHDVIKKCLL